MLVVVTLAVLVSVINIQALPVAAPFFLVWLSASQIAHWISRPSFQKPSDLTAVQVQRLRTLARRTWLFYEHFVGPDGNWLPPDHFQKCRVRDRPSHLAHQYRTLSADGAGRP